MTMHRDDLLVAAARAAVQAGFATLAVYQAEIQVEYKEDRSPLTLADKRSHEIIVGHLKKTGIPVLSEEGRNIPYAERSRWRQLWIVDPLDGTKEFVKRLDEFTVNIALVEDQRPTLGAIFVPVKNVLYFGRSKTAPFAWRTPPPSIAWPRRAWNVTRGRSWAGSGRARKNFPWIRKRTRPS